MSQQDWDAMAVAAASVENAARELARVWLHYADADLEGEAMPFDFGGERVMVGIVRCDEDGVPLMEVV